MRNLYKTAHTDSTSRREEEKIEPKLNKGFLEKSVRSGKEMKGWVESGGREGSGGEGVGVRRSVSWFSVLKVFVWHMVDLCGVGTSTGLGNESDQGFERLRLGE